MEKIARSLVIAIQYLGADRNDKEYTEDDDLKIVEEISSILLEASNEEKSLLLKVSKDLGLKGWGNQIGIE